VKRWLMAHSMRYQMGTHTSQCPPAEVASEALNYRKCRGLRTS
jgi:hypothetical protein